MRDEFVNELAACSDEDIIVRNFEVYFGEDAESIKGNRLLGKALKVYKLRAEKSFHSLYNEISKEKGSVEPNGITIDLLERLYEIKKGRDYASGRIVHDSEADYYISRAIENLAINYAKS